MLGMTMDRMFALVSLAIGLVATAPLHGEQRAAPSPGAGDGVEVVDLRTGVQGQSGGDRRHHPAARVATAGDPAGGGPVGV